MSDPDGGSPTAPTESSATSAPLGPDGRPVSNPPADAPSYLAVSSAPPRRGRRVATATAVALALVAGGFGILQLTAADGPQSPEDAVQAFFDAVEQEDVIGVIESLDPRERQILRDAVDSTKAEASRTEVASDDLDLRHVQGVDLKVSGLQMGVTPLTDGLSAVDLADGEVSTSAELDRMAIGPVIRDLLERRDKDPDLKGEDRKAEGTIDLRGVRLATTRTDGAWHVSVLYSIAEQARTGGDHDRPFPTGDPIAAKGADSPEAAVRQAVDALVAHDARRLVELAAPGEMDVLHTYGPLLVDAAEDGWAKEQQNLTVSDLGLTTTDGPRGSKVVSATSFKIHTEDDYGEGDTGSTDMVFDGKCTTFTSTWTVDTSWQNEGPDGVESSNEGFSHVDPSAPDGMSAEDSGPQTDTQKMCKGDSTATISNGLVPLALFSPFFIGGGAGSDLQVVTEQHDGAWFVSPTRSIFQTSLASLRALSVDDARRTARAWFGDEEWLLSPPEFWKACKVAQPGLDASRAEGEQAQEDCANALPDDYEGPWGPGAFASTRFEKVGTAIDGPSGSDDPAESCWNDAAMDGLDGAAYDAAYRACVQRLFDEGRIDGASLVDDQCNEVWTAWDDAHPDSDEGPSNAESEALDKAYQRCVDTTPLPTRPDGSSGVTVGPDASTVPGRVPASPAPPPIPPGPGD